VFFFFFLRKKKKKNFFFLVLVKNLEKPSQAQRKKKDCLLNYLSAW